LKDSTESQERMSIGSLFRARGLAAENALSPNLVHAHPANTKVTVCRRPKVVSNFRRGCRTAKIDRRGIEVPYSTKWFERQQTQFELNALWNGEPWSRSRVSGVTCMVVFLTATYHSSLADAFTAVDQGWDILVCLPVDCCSSRFLK